MTPQKIKKMANALRKCRTGEHYYDKQYKDLSVADLLLVLEDENWHTEETLVEALAHMAYADMVEACKLVVEQDEAELLPEDFFERRRELDKKIRSDNGN